MKRLTWIFALLLILSACKTTEENYRKSYVAAIQSKQEKTDSTLTAEEKEIYNKVIEQQKPRLTNVGEDSIRTSRNYAWMFYGNDIPLKKYNVVVGAMRQQFNAKAFCDRLRKSNCKSYVITDRDMNYFVVAEGFDTMEEAAKYLKNINKHIPFKLPLKEPYIYDTTRLH
jgi:septal ring-binding cell division protein DamX